MGCGKKCKFNDHFEHEMDRFVLEEDIIHQTDINDHINLLIEDILDNADDLDADHIVNALTGMIAVHEIRSNKLWEHFITIYELDEYAPRSRCKAEPKDENIDPDTWMKYQR